MVLHWFYPSGLRWLSRHSVLATIFTATRWRLGRANQGESAVSSYLVRITDALISAECGVLSAVFFADSQTKRERERETHRVRCFGLNSAVSDFFSCDETVVFRFADVFRAVNAGLRRPDWSAGARQPIRSRGRTRGWRHRNRSFDQRRSRWRVLTWRQIGSAANQVVWWASCKVDAWNDIFRVVNVGLRPPIGLPARGSQSGAGVAREDDVIETGASTNGVLDGASLL